MRVTIMMLISLLLFALVLAPVVVGILMMVRARRATDAPTCGRCRYDVSGSIGLTRCPECGSDFAEVGIVPPRQRRRGLFWIGLALAVLPLLTIGLGVASTSVAMVSAQRARQQAVTAQQQRAAASARAAAVATQALDDAEAIED